MLVKSKEIITDYTYDPICPHCGHTVLNAWELPFTDMEDDIELECGECCEEFICSRSVTVTYSTEKMEKKK